MRLAPWLWLPLLACNDGEETNCTTEAVVSVSVVVTDDAGNAVNDATVTYDGGGQTGVPCDHVSGFYLCGYEVDGAITVNVARDGFAPATQSVTVGADACHVIGESLAFEIEALDCTDVEVPAVEVTLRGSSNEALSDPDVWWRLASDPADTEYPCDAGLDAWFCAYDVSGEIVVSGTAGGHTTATETVTVGGDGCHPITESVELVVEWLPD